MENRLSFWHLPLTVASLSNCTAGSAASSPTGKDVVNRPPYAKFRESGMADIFEIWNTDGWICFPSILPWSSKLEDESIFGEKMFVGRDYGNGR